MAEHEEWTAGDDARVRAALGALRTDVDAVPLADPRFVRARGARLRRQRMVGWTAAAAAAVVVAGAVGYGQLGPDTTLPTPPARTPTTTPTTSRTASSLDTPGTLPLLAEWASAFDAAPGTMRLAPVKPFEAVECLDVEPGTKVQQESVTGEGGLSGGQVRFRLTAGSNAQTAASGVAADIVDCEAGPGFEVGELVETPSGRIYPYTAGDAGSGWFVVVSGIRDVAVLQVVEAGSAPRRSSSSVDSLAIAARERLLRYAVPQATASPSSPAPTGPAAVDEDMPVSGPEPRPPATLFVAASQWASEALTGGARTSAGPGALEGSTAVASCETEEQQSGVGGRVGVVSVRVGSGTTGYIGRQRVQLDQAAEPEVQKQYVDARLTEAEQLFGKGCTFGNGTVRATKGPTAGTYRLDTVFADGSPTLSEWVGVTAQRTPGAVSTVVLTRVSDPERAFDELQRLLALARQK